MKDLAELVISKHLQLEREEIMERFLNLVIIMAIVLSLLLMSAFTWSIVKPALIDSRVIEAIKTVAVENRNAITSLNADINVIKQSLVPRAPTSQ